MKCGIYLRVSTEKQARQGEIQETEQALASANVGSINPEEALAEIKNLLDVYEDLERNVSSKMRHAFPEFNVALCFLSPFSLEG